MVSFPQEITYFFRLDVNLKSVNIIYSAHEFVNIQYKNKIRTAINRFLQERNQRRSTAAERKRRIQKREIFFLSCGSDLLLSAAHT